MCVTKQNLFFWLFFFASLLGDAQSPAYLQFSVEDGLPSNLVYCAVQDHEGYLWFGTDKGLSRFDGTQFYNYGMKDGLPDPEVLELYVDPLERLWMSCFQQNPIFRYDGRFYNNLMDGLAPDLSMAYLNVNFFNETDSNLWVCGGNLLQVSGNSPEAPKVKRYKGKVREPHKVDSDWLSYASNRVCTVSFDDKNDSLIVEPIFTFEQDSGFIRAVGTSSGGLVAYKSNTYYFEYEQGALKNIVNLGNAFEFLYVDKDDNFWAIRPGTGVFCITNLSEENKDTKVYLPGKRINSVYKDRWGNLWFNSINEGLYCLPAKFGMTWNVDDGFQSDNILTLTKDAVGNIYTGDDIGNVYKLAANNRQVSLETKLSSSDGTNKIRKIIVADTMLIVLSDESIKYQSDFRNTMSKILLGSPKSAVEQSDYLWIGSSSGLVRIDKANKQSKRVSKDRITIVEDDHQGNVWIGKMTGMYSEADDFTQNWGDRYPLLSNRIIDIERGQPGQIYVVTSSSHILDLKIDQGKIYSLQSIGDNLYEKVGNIKSLKLAADGTLWIATNKGIFSISRDLKFNNYSTRHGLASQDVNDILFVNDTLWAATNRGVSCIYPKDFESLSAEGVTHLTGFEYEYQDSLVALDFSGRQQAPIALRMQPGATFMEATFAGLNRSLTERLSYEHVYKKELLPFPHFTFSNLVESLSQASDTILKDTPNWNFGISLTPNHYLIHSTALTYDGNNRLAPTQWELTVLPSWQQTIWPWLTLFLGIGWLIWRYFKISTVNLRLETDSNQAQLAALRSQINPHFIGNSINAIQQFFYPPNPEKASDYIHLFTVLLRKTLQMSERDFVSIQEEITYAQNYLDMIKLRYADQFQFTIQKADNIDIALAFPSMFIQPILENATVHGLALKGPSILQLSFSIEEGRLICCVLDNGIGLQESLARKKGNSPYNRQSKGIKLLKSKMKMLNRLHQINMRIQWIDLKNSDPNALWGTKVRLSYDLHKTPTSK
ncbi:MAG: two-component regulator propeller domain-containing protein [Bacteroidota bacterium]